MGHPDDYRDEMDRMSSKDADEVLSGRRPGTAAARSAGAAADRLRSELLVPPPPEVARRHLAAMRAATGPDPRRPRRDVMQKRTKRQLSTLGLAAALVLGAGLATALTLPDQASDQAKQQVADVVLPDQATGPGATAGDESLISDAASEHGKAVSEAAHDDSTKGCEHGRAVSELASSKAADTRQNEGDHPGPCGPNDGQGAGGASAAAHAAKGTHGQSSSTHGQSSSANGKSSSSHGKSAEDHGKDDLPHGLGAGSAPDDLPTNNQ